MTTVATESRAAALAEQRARRLAEATGPRGAASFLWGDFVTDPNTRVEGAAGLWSPLPDGRPGLSVLAAAPDGVRIGDELVDGEAVLWASADRGPDVAYFADGAEGVVFSYDGTRYALQVWNRHSAWAQRLAGISAYDEDDAWRVPATVTLVEGGRTVAISHHRDPRPIDVPVVAEVTLEREGCEHTLLATRGAPGVEGLCVLFTDATNGTETYSAGRVVALPSRRAGAVVLDVNLASLLPCAFSLAWNCPIPPPENALPFAVRAGERHAVDAAGEALL